MARLGVDGLSLRVKTVGSSESVSVGGGGGKGLSVAISRGCCPRETIAILFDLMKVCRLRLDSLNHGTGEWPVLKMSTRLKFHERILSDNGCCILVHKEKT